MSQKPQTICTVSFRSAGGTRWSFTTMGHSTYEAVRNAWEWYHGPAWHGPRPARETVFDLTTPAAGRYRVRAAAALDAPKQLAQTPLFPVCSEPFDPR